MREKNIELRVVNTYYLHREVYGPEHPVTITTDSELHETKCSLGFDYDYERMPAKGWLFHGDVTLAIIPYGKIMLRTTCSFTATSAELSLHKVMSTLIKLSYDAAVGKGWTQFCKDNNLTFTGNIPVDDEIIMPMTTHTLETLAHRLRDDMLPDNHYLRNTPGMRLTSGDNTKLIVLGTFIILDNLLYEDPMFNNAQNREVFCKFIPLTIYQTVKWKSIQIEKGEIQLNWMHTIFFFMCIDCALQILLGDNANKLIPGAEAKGLDEQNRTDYIEFTTGLIRQLKNQLKSNKATFSNLELQYNWNDKMS